MLAHAALALIVAATLLGCDGDDEAPAGDPATSQDCIKARMKYIESKYQIDQGAELGADDSLVALKRVQLEQFQSAHWACFR
jgi:hypothetical protein